MKKLSALLVVLAVMFAASGNSFAQPKLIIHLTGGYSLPMSSLAGDAADLFASPQPTTVTTEPKAYMKTGFNFGADVKYAFDKKGSVRGVLGLSYNMFSNSYDIPTTVNPTATKFKPQINFFTASLGAEYAFLPKGKANPFIGVDFTANFYSGKMTLDPVPTGFTEQTLKSGSRFGLQFGAGVDIALSKNIGIVVGGQYHLINLIGKQDYDSTATPVANEYELIDKEHTIGGQTISAMNLGALKFYTGVSFYLMQPKKKMKK